jgi:peptide/nickel transport system permease protein
MHRYIIRRTLQAIPTLFGITIVVYFLMLLAPGDPVALLAFDPKIRQDERERLARQLGVNDPFFVQYLRWLIGDDWMMVDTNLDEEVDSWGDNYGILRGDFGTSFKFRGSNPLNLIAERLGATIELNILVLIFGLTSGLLIGILAAVYRGRLLDRFTRVFAVLGVSIPVFFLGLLAIIYFGIELPRFLEGFGIGDGRPILPMGGRCPPVRGGCPPIYERLHYLILPVLVSALSVIAGWSRFMRASMLETINSDYMRTARSKGLSSQSVWFRHGFRNAILPLTVFLGPAIVSLIGGSVIIERIFTWPGIGLLLFDALLSRDHPVIMASVVIGSVLTIIGYLLSDMLYALLDPRVRY